MNIPCINLGGSIVFIMFDMRLKIINLQPRLLGANGLIRVTLNIASNIIKRLWFLCNWRRKANEYNVVIRLAIYAKTALFFILSLEVF